ncbi:hypothetical protein DFH29DRAFT_1005443 [Suillus ampliporus]|nr:hypothetical protein DFH29DRAFT_1005443 [Suillus ampliporus]
MALTHPKGQAGINAKLKKTVTITKPPAITHVKQNWLHNTGSSTSVDDETADDPASEPVKKKCKRGDGATDILTIFKLVDDKDPSQGYVCEPCVKLHEANLKKHGKLQTIFKGNNTTMHTHIQCMGMSHYRRYRKKCVQQDINMDEQCVPQEELDRLEGKATNMQQSILDFAETVEPTTEPQYMKDGLQEHIIRFILETDQALSLVNHKSFCDLLTYNSRNKTKDVDILHRTKITTCVLKYADEIQRDLAKELQESPGHVSLTFDGWTSKIMTSYLAVMGH